MREYRDQQLPQRVRTALVIVANRRMPNLYGFLYRWDVYVKSAISPAPTPAGTPIATSAPTTLPLFTLMVPEAADCELESNSTCISDGSGPYGNNENCTYRANVDMVLNLTSLRLQHGDGFVIHDRPLNLPNHFDDVAVRAGTIITWLTDSIQSIQREGYHLCGVPCTDPGTDCSTFFETFAPTTAPSTSPTQAGVGLCSSIIPVLGQDCPTSTEAIKALPNCLDAAYGSLCEGDGECGSTEIDNCLNGYVLILLLV